MEISLNNSHADYLSIASSIFQIIFWIVISIVTILGYINAKASIFQPIKTEIFKLQIEEFKKILEVFYGKTEYDLRDLCSYDLSLKVNIRNMFDDYVFSAFDMKRRGDEPQYDKNDYPLIIVSGDHMKKYFMKVDGYKKGEIDNFSVKKDWVEYEHYLISIHRNYQDFSKTIDGFSKNPLLPNKLLHLINEYRSVMAKNITLIGDILTESAKMMPVHYPNFEEMQNATFHWIESKYNDKFEELEPYSEKIVNFIRDYFKTDNIIVYSKNS